VRLRQKWKPPAWTLRIAGGLAIAVVWEIGGRRSRSLLFPSFSETLTALYALLFSGDLWTALWASNAALAVGFSASLIGGIPLGLALGRWTRIDRWIDPYVTLLLVLPTTALIPIVFMLGGLGLVARAVVVCVFSLPVVATCSRASVQQVEPRLLDMARSFGATPWQEWRTVLLPAATPGVMTGVRLGLARAVEGMIVVELLLVAVGIGRLLLDFQGRFEAASVYAVILVVMAEAMVLTDIGRRLERRLSPGSIGEPS
jgi:ABC-type nitrate/sulfonate/bicarbonate transport system permease component